MAGESVVLTWSVTNWITVLIMVLVGFLVIGAAAGLVQRARSKSDANR